MNTARSTTLAIAIHIFTGAAAGLACAQTPSTVDVHGKPDVPPAALHAACPQAFVELPDALAATAIEVARASVVTVRFEIDGGRLYLLQTQGGASAQAVAVRRAVRNLGCSNGSAGRQRVHFQVRFVDPFDRAASQAVALQDLNGHGS
jgi:hypothetical protein